MATQKIEIIIGKDNAGKKIVKADKYKIVAESIKWNNNNIIKMTLTLEKKFGNNNVYNLFHANLCDKGKHCNDCENKDTIQIHVIKTKLSGVYRKEFTLPPIEIKKDEESVFIEILEYDYKKKQDNEIIECGEKTGIPTPNSTHSPIDPTPERKGKSILVGKT